MSQNSCDKNSTCETCSQEGTCSEDIKAAHTEELLRQTIGRIKHKFMVMSGKGGVGKSTVAANLAVTLAKNGNTVGLLDGDIHGPNIPKMLGVDLKRLEGSSAGIEPVSVSPNLKVVSIAFMLQDTDTPIVWRGPLKHGAFKQFLSEVLWGDLDYLIVDLPPGTGDEPLSIAQLIAHVDGSIVVTTPQDIALLDSRKAVTFSRTLRIPVVGVVENMSGFSCPHCGKPIDLFKMGGGEKAASELHVPFLGRIVFDPDIVLNADMGKAIVDVFPESKATKAFQEISKKCEDFANGSGFGGRVEKTETSGISRVKEILRK
ncbi:MAG: Mrp/NBP35 family ATP-binding protein [Thermodesulfobacteriota bacterium]|nr:Mrp/NBP35 family ATP-binding protein [Thermodesulfobacteriota bacterium]